MFFRASFSFFFFFLFFIIIEKFWICKIEIWVSCLLVRFNLSEFFEIYIWTLLYYKFFLLLGGSVRGIFGSSHISRSSKILIVENRLISFRRCLSIFWLNRGKVLIHNFTLHLRGSINRSSELADSEKLGLGFSVRKTGFVRFFCC